MHCESFGAEDIKILRYGTDNPSIACLDSVIDGCNSIKPEEEHFRSESEHDTCREFGDADEIVVECYRIIEEERSCACYLEVMFQSHRN